MHDASNQLPPEFDHLRDDEFPDVIIPESSYKDDTEVSRRQKIKGALGLTLSKSLLGLAGLVLVVLVAKQFIHPSTQSVGDHYQALEQLDADTKPQVSQSTNKQPKPEEDANLQTEAAHPSLQPYEMAQADIKREAANEFTQDAELQKDERINQRLSLVEDAVQKILISNEAHEQSIELLRNEQAQLMVKMHGNETALADMKNRVEVMQTKLSAPKVRAKNDSMHVIQTDKNTPELVKTRLSAPAVAPPSVEVKAPIKSRVQLPVNLRLVSVKNMNGKNTAVLRIGGEFSPMLFEGQTWMGIQILNASVNERSAQVRYQGDEFGLLL